MLNIHGILEFTQITSVIHWSVRAGVGIAPALQQSSRRPSSHQNKNKNREQFLTSLLVDGENGKGAAPYKHTHTSSRKFELDHDFFRTF